MSRSRKPILSSCRGGGSGHGDGPEGPTSTQIRMEMVAALRRLADDSSAGRVDLSRYLATPDVASALSKIAARREATNDA